MPSRRYWSLAVSGCRYQLVILRCINAFAVSKTLQERSTGVLIYWLMEFSRCMLVWRDVADEFRQGLKQQGRVHARPGNWRKKNDSQPANYVDVSKKKKVPQIEKLVMPDGVSHKASQEKSKAFGSRISESRKEASSKLGMGCISVPLLPFATTLASSVSGGGGNSRALSDAIFDTGSAHLSKQ